MNSVGWTFNCYNQFHLQSIVALSIKLSMDLRLENFHFKFLFALTKSFNRAPSSFVFKSIHSTVFKFRLAAISFSSIQKAFSTNWLTRKLSLLKLVWMVFTITSLTEIEFLPFTASTMFLFPRHQKGFARIAMVFLSNVSAGFPRTTLLSNLRT